MHVSQTADSSPVILFGESNGGVGLTGVCLSLHFCPCPFPLLSCSLWPQLTCTYCLSQAPLPSGFWVCPIPAWPELSQCSKNAIPFRPRGGYNLLLPLLSGTLISSGGSLSPIHIPKNGPSMKILLGISSECLFFFLLGDQKRMRLDTESTLEDFLEEGVSSAGFCRRGTIV